MVYNIVRGGDRQKATGSPKAEIGEIDTRAPFESVKAAVSLFGEVALNKEKSVRKPRLSSENVLDKDALAQILLDQDKETQLLLAQAEIERSKQKIDSAESTKARALNDLEKAKTQVQDLTARLKIVTESKESAVKAAESANKQANQLELAKSQIHLESYSRNQELEYEREQYLKIATELDAAKQELNEIRQDFDATLEAKQAAFQQTAEAKRSAEVSSEMVVELQKEIKAMKEAIKQIMLASKQENEEQEMIESEKDILMQSHRSAIEEGEKKLINLRKEYDPELNASLEMKFAETTAEIESLKKQKKEADAAEMDLMRVVINELNEATRTLQKFTDEECSLRNLVSSLKMEVEDVKREYADELNEKEKESDEHNLDVQQLSSENKTAGREAEEMTRTAQDLMQGAETALTVTEETEKKLRLALSELEEAKKAEKKALDELNILSLKPGSVAKIGITKEEFESMNTKVADSGELAGKKLADALAQLEALNASKNEADRKLEKSLKAIEEIKAATEMALKSAEMAAAAQSMVEGELRKWRHQEQTTATA